jgi:hypothetical protein
MGSPFQKAGGQRMIHGAAQAFACRGGFASGFALLNGFCIGVMNFYEWVFAFADGFCIRE